MDQTVAWLLANAPVPRGSPHHGGVSGWVTRDGSRVPTAYPEIAGYFLHFLTQLGPEHRTDALATRICKWLDSISKYEPPLTYYFENGMPNWRNDAIFTFDLAIILRGLAAVRSRWPQIPIDSVGGRLHDALAGIQMNGILGSHRFRNQSMPALPVKWSTIPGPHHVKAAAGIVAWGDERSRSIALSTADYWCSQFSSKIDVSIQTPHSFMYFIEGLLFFWAHSSQARYIKVATDAFNVALEGLGDPLAPQTVSYSAGRLRSDELAQFLRVGQVLQRAERICPGVWQRCSKVLADVLRRRTKTDGAILFDDEHDHRNVLCGIFAWQAHAFLKMNSTDARHAAVAII